MEANFGRTLMYIPDIHSLSSWDGYQASTSTCPAGQFTAMHTPSSRENRFSRDPPLGKEGDIFAESTSTSEFQRKKTSRHRGRRTTARSVCTCPFALCPSNHITGSNNCDEAFHTSSCDPSRHGPLRLAAVSPQTPAFDVEDAMVRPLSSNAPRGLPISASDHQPKYPPLSHIQVPSGQHNQPTMMTSKADLPESSPLGSTQEQMYRGRTVWSRPHIGDCSCQSHPISRPGQTEYFPAGIGEQRLSDERTWLGQHSQLLRSSNPGVEITNPEVSHQSTSDHPTGAMAQLTIDDIFAARTSALDDQKDATSYEPRLSSISEMEGSGPLPLLDLPDIGRGSPLLASRSDSNVFAARRPLTRPRGSSSRPGYPTRGALPGLENSPPASGMSTESSVSGRYQEDSPPRLVVPTATDRLRFDEPMSKISDGDRTGRPVSPSPADYVDVEEEFETHTWTVVN
ncbi:hypothetical protein IAR55_005773 [Kwoniella newhampshirensis]|uniref:Copper-fist domain-containing protein n=1 Tax=Kwoniella newhampshirensis TaxID=1651941 RepID=A0AAW0YUW5_9TREE